MDDLMHMYSDVFGALELSVGKERSQNVLAGVSVYV